MSSQNTNRPTPVGASSVAASTRSLLLQARSSSAQVPPLDHLFSIEELVARNPHILKESSIRWAARNRFENGAEEAFYKTQSGQLLVNEPVFMAWYLNLESRNRPRAPRRRSRS